MSSLQSLDIAARSATTTQPPHARNTAEVAKLIDVSSCIGCKACQVACMQWNDLRDTIGNNVGVYDNPADLSPESWTVMRYSEVEMKVSGTEETRLEWLIRKDGCMHCEDPGCLKACPAPGAIVKYTNGIVDFISENCIGCGNCVTGCPFDVPRISKKDDRAYKCSLCSDRVTVGLEPACVKACPTGAIHFGTKSDMLDYGGERVADLKERGYAQAAVYNPSGVGGTHVMYVLQHGDKPELYHGLPNNPTISPLVSLWKGAVKPLALAAMVGAAVVSFFHYNKVGPLEVEEDEPDDALANAVIDEAPARNKTDT
ncbi:formate dehydrogenase subunit beta [Variovorax sp. dw_308]|uniref:formate dehydrogenase subunit beta n=1 Tax=Variovorax sp. dw_308 TaxID=2721546 RepID=UPI001C485BD7|nr:formate dehydrogenase subunit beta [Variovorax sp. dw_308]